MEPFATAVNPCSLAIGDVDENGKRDLVISHIWHRLWVCAILAAPP